VDRIGEFRARAWLEGGGVARKREEYGRECRHRRYKGYAAGAKHERQTFGGYAGHPLPTRQHAGLQTLDRDHGQASEKRDPQENAHRGLDPVNVWPVARKAPDHDRTKSTEQPHVFHPVEGGEE
jgi:hypothetical protein